MPKNLTLPTEPPKEHAFLVGIEIHSQPSMLSMEDSLSELAQLADTAGLFISGETYQRIDKPDSATFIGSGKVEEIKFLLEDTSSDLVIFDNELSSRNLRELEERFNANVRVIDRTALILDIFAQHAHTREGKLQVELAQYEYRLPRLTRAWTHLARQAGGASGRSGTNVGVGLRGPGETQLEVDRREIGRRISVLKRELEKVRQHRSRYRYHRKRNQIPVSAIVGYTNSGKSTLLNRLSDAGIYVANKLFATLDPTTRRVKLPNGQTTLFTDTVGFIQRLPTQLVVAFHATLEEITEANLLIHVVDISHPAALIQWRVVQQTLKEIGADFIPYVTVLNKIDRINQELLKSNLPAEFSNVVRISALTGEGISELLGVIEKHLFKTYITVKVQLPYIKSHLISMFHEQGRIIFIEHCRGGVEIHGQIPGRLMPYFQPFEIKNAVTEIDEKDA